VFTSDISVGFRPDLGPCHPVTAIESANFSRRTRHHPTWGHWWRYSCQQRSNPGTKRIFLSCPCGHRPSKAPTKRLSSYQNSSYYPNCTTWHVNFTNAKVLEIATLSTRSCVLGPFRQCIDRISPVFFSLYLDRVRDNFTAQPDPGFPNDGTASALEYVYYTIPKELSKTWWI
jgi:hypothetical protein